MAEGELALCRTCGKPLRNLVLWLSGVVPCDCRECHDALVRYPINPNTPHTIPMSPATLYLPPECLTGHRL